MITEKYKDSFEQGFNKEEQLVSILKDNGCTYKRATKKIDITEHWDYAFRDKKNKFNLKSFSDNLDYYRIDIKSTKRINRGDNQVSTDHHWIELKNVVGNKGWMYGKADYIVFEIPKGWIFVDREKLVELIEDKTKGKINRSYKSECYELYRRKGRKDSVTKVPIVDLLEITDLILNS